MRTPGFKWFSVIGMCVVAMLASWLWLRRTQPATNSPAPISSNQPAAPDSRREWDEKLRGDAAALAGATDAAGRNDALALLRKALAGGSTNEVSAAIRRFLDSRIDASTGRGFKIGNHGFLTEAPTLRAFLLDYLAQIDPAAAAEYARVILNSKDSPDEWALALRNLALGDTGPDAHALLEEKTGELLNYKDWQENPSAGYLEAFDTAVYLGGTNFVPALAGMVSMQNNPALSHAAFLALDRLVSNDPTALLSALLAQPNLMQGREQTRADYFARADVRDPRQLDLLQNYLLNPQTSAAELQQFAGVFPSANFMISPNLLTSNPTPDHAALVVRDVASLQVVGQWLADPRFAKLRPQLFVMQQRLQLFVQQEQSAGR